MLTVEQAYDLLKTRFDREGYPSSKGQAPRLFYVLGKSGKLTISKIVKDCVTNFSLGTVSAKSIEKLKTFPDLESGACGHRPDMFTAKVYFYLKFKGGD